MSSSQRPMVHQDYIARIRYSNALPPPPNPPKLLDIPGTGLSGGQYTSAGYASRLAREQPLNIEADAELGMPIDLIGLPGVFEGDDSAIMARPGQQTIHPADRALLKPLAMLGKPAASASVSFLRRTEYTASQSVQHIASSTHGKDVSRVKEEVKRRRPSANKEDPINIMRNIIKGFDVAYPKDAYRGEDSTTNLRGAQPHPEDFRAWSEPTHPTNPTLKLLDSYPVLPDLDAIPTTGFYLVMKFSNNPLVSGSSHDERLNSAILRPVNDAHAETVYQQKLADWTANPTTQEPIREYDYDYYIPAEESSVHGIKRKLDVNDPHNDDPQLYTDDVGEGQRAFKYTRLRTYETQNQQGDSQNCYNDTVALAMHDETPRVGAVSSRKRLQKGIYFYPIVQRTSLRVKRLTMRQTQTEEPKVDELNVTVADMDETLKAVQREKQSIVDPPFPVATAAG